MSLHKIISWHQNLLLIYLLNRIILYILTLNILPWGMVNFFTMWMLIFEVFIGILVIFGIWLRASSFVLTGFGILCTFLISYALINDLSMHCGCFVAAATGKPRTFSSLYQEGIMLLGCILLLMTTRNEKLKI